MAGRTSRLVGLFGGIAAAMLGCQSSGRKPAYSDNPLLANRQPLIHSAKEREQAAAAAHARSNPSLPPPTPVSPPPATVVQNPSIPPPSWDLSPGPALPEMPASAAQPALMPLPARTLTDPPTGMMPASAVETPSAASRILKGKYGFSTDYSWLQGELDRHYRGYLELRFRPSSEEDTFGGKVWLEDDPRLAEFHAGDIVAVEGELIRAGDESAGQYPRFRIRSVRLIER